MIGDVNAVGLHKQVVEVSAAHLDTERTVGVQRTLSSLNLDLDPGVGRLPASDHFDLAVGPVVLAVRRLQNECATFGEPHLEGGDGLILNLVISVTTREFVEGVHELSLTWAFGCFRSKILS